MLFSLLIAASTFSAVIPPEPEFWNKPDSVLIYSGSKLIGSTSIIYNGDGYVTKMNSTGSVFENLSITAVYNRNKDTITCTSSYSDGSDEEKATYILDQSNRVIKCNYYEANEIVEIDSLIYINEKIVKTIISNPVSGTNAGDSIVYTYDQNGNLKSSKQFGDSGKTWAYAEFESDASGRISKCYVFECDAGCEKTGNIIEYHYTSIAGIRRYTAIDHLGSFSLKISPANLTVTSQNGAQLKSLGLYDLKGNKISSITIGNQTSGAIDLKNLPTQFYLVRVETNSGWMSRKVFISGR